MNARRRPQARTARSRRRCSPGERSASPASSWTSCSVPWARSAFCARSAWPTVPSERTTSDSPALSASISASATSGRPPWCPDATAFASRSKDARTTSSGAGSPSPTRWPKIAERLNARASFVSTVAPRRMPTPVVTPYVGVPSCATRSTTARRSRMRTRASSASATVSLARATRTTSSSVRSAPVSSTVMRGL